MAGALLAETKQWRTVIAPRGKRWIRRKKTSRQLATRAVRSFFYGRQQNSGIMSLVGCLHDPTNVQQTSSISTCILNTFAASMLDVCWNFAGSREHPIKSRRVGQEVAIFQKKAVDLDFRQSRLWLLEIPFCLSVVPRWRLFFQNLEFLDEKTSDKMIFRQFADNPKFRKGGSCSLTVLLAQSHGWIRSVSQKTAKIGFRWGGKWVHLT